MPRSAAPCPASAASRSGSRCRRHSPGSCPPQTAGRDPPSRGVPGPPPCRHGGCPSPANTISRSVCSPGPKNRPSSPAAPKARPASPSPALGSPHKPPLPRSTHSSPKVRARAREERGEQEGQAKTRERKEEERGPAPPALPEPPKVPAEPTSGGYRVVAGGSGARGSRSSTDAACTPQLHRPLQPLAPHRPPPQADPQPAPRTGRRLPGCWRRNGARPASSGSVRSGSAGSRRSGRGGCCTPSPRPQPPTLLRAPSPQAAAGGAGATGGGGADPQGGHGASAGGGTTAAGGARGPGEGTGRAGGDGAAAETGLGWWGAGARGCRGGGMEGTGGGRGGMGDEGRAGGERQGCSSVVPTPVGCRGEDQPCPSLPRVVGGDVGQGCAEPPRLSPLSLPCPICPCCATEGRGRGEGA